MSSINEQRFLTAMRGLRNTLAGAVDQLDLILDLAEQRTTDTISGERKPGECPHPIAARTAKATMGHPGRFHCNVCGKDVEG